MSKEEKQKYILEQLKKKQPNVDKRVKTEDVTNTKGLTFKDFNLSQELQLVSKAAFISIYERCVHW